MTEPNFTRVTHEHIRDYVTAVRQSTDYWCGVACVQMVLGKHGTDVTQHQLAEEMRTSPDTGTEMRSIIAAVESRGFRADPIPTLDQAFGLLWHGTSVLLYYTAYGSGHYSLLIGGSRKHWYLADPAMENGIGWVDKRELIGRLLDFPLAITKLQPRESERTVPCVHVPL